MICALLLILGLATADTLEFDNGSRMNITYSLANDNIVFDVLVMNNSYVGIGYGNQMTNTDLVFWSANGTESFCQDLWGYAKRKPLIDTYNAYTTKFTVNEDESILF